MSVELCRETTHALQELLHGIANVLLDILEQMDLDAGTLWQLLDDHASVSSLMDGDTGGLATETMVEFLEKLYSHFR